MLLPNFARSAEILTQWQQISYEPDLIVSDTLLPVAAILSQKFNLPSLTLDPYKQTSLQTEEQYFLRKEQKPISLPNDLKLRVSQFEVQKKIKLLKFPQSSVPSLYKMGYNSTCVINIYPKNLDLLSNENSTATQTVKYLGPIFIHPKKAADEEGKSKAPNTTAGLLADANEIAPEEKKTSQSNEQNQNPYTRSILVSISKATPPPPPTHIPINGAPILSIRFSGGRSLLRRRARTRLFGQLPSDQSVHPLAFACLAFTHTNFSSHVSHEFTRQRRDFESAGRLFCGQRLTPDFHPDNGQDKRANQSNDLPAQKHAIHQPESSPRQPEQV